MKIRIFIYFLLLLSLSVHVTTQTKRALVIGLGEQQDKAWNKINGCVLTQKKTKILVEGYDDRNSYTYIICLTKGLLTIQLPCNAGNYGMSSEEDLPIGQSYVYYKKGGKFNIISVFDWNGNCLTRIRVLKYVKNGGNHCYICIYKGNWYVNIQ